MIGLDVDQDRLILLYGSDLRSFDWLDDKLMADGVATLSKVFTVRSADLLDLDGSENEDVRRFVIGDVTNEYYIVRADVLGIKHDLYLTTSHPVDRKTFVAERNISIFRRIDRLIDEQIVVGGPRERAIPLDEFERLLRTFPTSTELSRYADARVTRILREYLDTMSDAERRLVDYIDRRERAAAGRTGGTRGRLPVANELELAKFIYVRDRLVEMLEDVDGYSEPLWRESVADLLLLIYPQYVAVLQEVHVKEEYSKQSKPTDRYVDIALVDARGCLDIIEIKKPFDHSLMSKSRYRDNYVPNKELSGSIMQAEKYLFYLSKSGPRGEKAINDKYAKFLPDGLKVKIANPRAIILSGRDKNLTVQQLFDFEFARRKYANVMDIVSYDDLLRRLENVIASLEARATTDNGLIQVSNPTGSV